VTDDEPVTDGNENNDLVDANVPDRQDLAAQSVRKVTVFVLGFCLSYFIWYLIADRLTPHTDNARVRGYIVPIVPQVSGQVIKVNVQKNQIVKKNQVLIEIDQEAYQLAFDEAFANLEQTSQDTGATAQLVKAAHASLMEAETQYQYTLRQGDRVFDLERQGIVSRSDGDKTRTAIAQAKVAVASAKAELEKVKLQLGKQGEDNPKVKAAIARAKKAKLDLDRASITAPTDGGVTNVKIDVGQYAKAGQPLMIFISTTDVWVEAYMRENSLSNIKVGNSVDIVLDISPGRVFKGVVASVGFGVQWDTASDPSGLPAISGGSGWLREAQRFPVIIKFSDNSAYGLRREGGQADVIVYTGENFLINFVGNIWIHLVSIFSYAY
jgi:multidrug resistance efflux pump